jgi:hypothetical protein
MITRREFATTLAVAASGWTMRARAAEPVRMRLGNVAGFKLRYLPNMPGQQRLFGAADGLSRSALKARRKTLTL